MQTFDLPRILLQFVVLLPIVASLYLWFRYLSKAERPFWGQPRPFDLSRHSSTLLLTGGLMIFGNALVQTAFLPDVLDRYAPTVEKTHEEITDKEFGIERELVQTQSSVVVNLVFAGLALIVIFLQPGNDRKRVGFRGDDLPRQAWYGLQGFLLAILPVYVLVLLILPLKENEEAVHPLLRMMAEGQFNNRYVFWACLSAIVVSPIQEEILYRVLLQEGMVSLGYRWQYVIPGVAVFFSLMHLFPDMIPLFPLAILFGLVMHFRNSFLAVVLMHMLFNAFNILLTMISNPW